MQKLVPARHMKSEKYTLVYGRRAGRCRPSCHHMGVWRVRLSTRMPRATTACCAPGQLCHRGWCYSGSNSKDDKSGSLQAGVRCYVGNSCTCRCQGGAYCHQWGRCRGGAYCRQWATCCGGECGHPPRVGSPIGARSCKRCCVAERRWQRQQLSGSAAAAAWRQRGISGGGGGKGGGGSLAAARRRRRQRRPAWRWRVSLVAAWRQQRKQRGGSPADAAAAATTLPPWWQRRHWRRQRWRGHRQQSTII